MLVGADESTDSEILQRADVLYTGYRLRRVYYSGFSPIPEPSSLLPIKPPPLVREHRLYQADWLLRFYDFKVGETRVMAVNALVRICQIIVALGLLNVWLLRFDKPTAYRGGTSANMPGEFAAYGLPAWSCYLVGFLKVASAIALLAGLLYPTPVLPAALIVALLMAGALAMHVKVGDPFKKSVPALSVLALCVITTAGHWPGR
jgi:hypothetical protein